MNENTSEPRQSTRRRLLRAGVGVAATALAAPTLSTTAIAHFPPKLEIDVEPEDDSNCIASHGRGVVPVAVLQTEEFDPASEDVRYRFGAPDVVSSGGGARPIHDGHVEDVDGDGSDDLVLHFRTRDAGFGADASNAELRWERNESGEHGLSGTAPVTIVGPESGDAEKRDSEDERKRERGPESEDERGC
ncbi:hypothetical protein DMJ13_00235 [halophilic archaeon]|nr:hypothetical protein DMJ13_00235 [halophilic archaeon]